MKSSKRQTVERNEENCSKCESRNEINKKGKLETKNLGIQIGTSESSLTSRIQEIEGGISFIEDKIEKKMDTLVKEMVNLKKKIQEKVSRESEIP